MQFACLRCRAHVHVSLGEIAAKFEPQRATKHAKTGNRDRAASVSRESDRDASGLMVTEGASGQREASPAIMEPTAAAATRCGRCDGWFHTGCMPSPSVSVGDFECPACQRGVESSQEGEDTNGELPLLVPVQILPIRGVEKDELEVDTDDDMLDDDVFVFTEDIQVCTSCRQVHVEAGDTAPCAQCAAPSRFHRRCQEASLMLAPPPEPASKKKTLGRKRKRGANRTAVSDACTNCIVGEAAGVMTTRRLALLLHKGEGEWWDTCITCDGSFCLQSLVGDADEDEDVLRARFGSDSSAGFQCHGCIQSFQVQPLVQRPFIVEDEDESKVLLCDSCEGEFAMAKLNPPLLEVPEGEWFCPICIRQGKTTDQVDTPPSVIQEVVDEGVSEIVTLLICDGCEGEFDMATVMPPLESIPEGEWFCGQCEAKSTVTIEDIQEEVEVELPAPPPVEPEIATPPEAPVEIIPEAEASIEVVEEKTQGIMEAAVEPTSEEVKTQGPKWDECDGCDAPRDPNAPPGDWFCDQCETSRKKRKKGYGALKMEKAKRLKAEGKPVPPVSTTIVKPRPKPAFPKSYGLGVPSTVTFLICDGCEGEFDIASIYPPLTHVPRGDWYCATCVANRKAQRAGAAVTGPRKAKSSSNGSYAPPALSNGVNMKKLKVGAGVLFNYVVPKDELLTIDPGDSGVIAPPPVTVSLSVGTAGAQASPQSTTCSHVVCSDEEEANQSDDDDDECVIIVCDICLEEFNMVDVIGESSALQPPPRPWYCLPCLKRLKKNRKKKQRISKQMMLEIQLYGGLLRSTAAKVVDPVLRALRGKKPTSDDEMLALVSLIGRRVGVLLSWDKQWVMGRILAFDTRTCHHLVRFADNTEEQLPLFAFPLIIGTATVIQVKVPGFDNVWKPAEVLKMNAIAERQLARTLDDPSILASFRLVSVYVEGDRLTGKPPNVACWVPRHLCRALSAFDGAATDECPSLQSAEEKEGLAIARSVFSSLLQQAISQHLWPRFGPDLVGEEVCVRGDPSVCKVASVSESGIELSTGDQFSEKWQMDLAAIVADLQLTRSESLAKLVLNFHKLQCGMPMTNEAVKAENEDELAIAKQSNQASIRPPPSVGSRGHVCDGCRLPPAVDGDLFNEDTSQASESLVQCVKCNAAYHRYCCDPPYDHIPLISAEDDSVVLVEDIKSPFVCRGCVTCAGCETKTAAKWYQWRLPLKVVSLCENCVLVFDNKWQCGVCNLAFDDRLVNDSCALLKCTSCQLWVHPHCEPDQHPAFRRRQDLDLRSFELDLEIALPDLSIERTEDFDAERDDEGDDHEEHVQTSIGADSTVKPARLVDEEYAQALKFRAGYDSRVFHNYECLTCRQIRILRALHRLRVEDKLDLFKEPVTKAIAPTYFDVIKQPMDLRSMQEKALHGSYVRVNFRDFRDDFELLCLNAVTFNSRDRDFLIWREAWRFYGQGQRVLRQVVPKCRIKQRGGRHYDALVLAAKRQLPNNSLISKTKHGGVAGGDEEDDDEDDPMDAEEEDAEDGEDDEVVEERIDDLTAAETTEASSAITAEGTADASVGEDAGSKSTSENAVAAVDRRRLLQSSMAGAIVPFQPQSELSSIPKPHSLLSFYVKMHSRSGAHSNCWVDACALCGTRGVEGNEMLFCVDCGEGFHAFCAGVDETLLDPAHYASSIWRCINCEMCELCGKPRHHDNIGDNDELDDHWRSCHNCGRGYHGSCLLPAVGGSTGLGVGTAVDVTSDEDQDDDDFDCSSNSEFYCSHCVRCESCTKTAPLASYSFDHSLCLACCTAKQAEQSSISGKTKSLVQVWTAEARRQRQDADKCPMCRRKWGAEDADLIQCDACDCWAHPQCDSMFVEEPEAYQRLVSDSTAQYTCETCRSMERVHVHGVPYLSKCQLLVSRIQHTRALSVARWSEAKQQMKEVLRWNEWKENIAVYLYVLRIGEECLKTLAYRSVNFQDDWNRLTTGADRGMEFVRLLPPWIVQKATRYVRFKRYVRAPRAAERKLQRKADNFYSQQGLDKKDPSAIATIAAQASSCAALLVCVRVLYGWAPLQRVVFHLLERENGKRLNDRLIKAVCVDNDETLEDEIATIRRQYERLASKKHLIKIQAEDGEPENGDAQDTTDQPAPAASPTQAAEPITPKSESTEGIASADVAPVDEQAVPLQVVPLTRALPMSRDEARHCGLCFIVGDHVVCGRLIYVDMDQWVHINCAMWSAEVYEDTSGVLHKCQKALSRSKTNRCDACGVLGATVGCGVSRCQRHYHFPCALDHGVVFLPSRETCCPHPSHIQQMAKKLQLPEAAVASVGGANHAWMPLEVEPEYAEAGAVREGDGAQEPHENGASVENGALVTASAPVELVLTPIVKEPRRVLHVDFSSLLGDTKKRMHALHLKRQVGSRIGALTVHSLGHIVIGNSSFYTRDAIYPLGFRSTRIYWSTRDVGVRCLYECVVTSTDVEARQLSKAKDDSVDTRLRKPLFKITASDDRENPIIASTPNESLLELRSRIIALYEDVRSENPFLTRRSWFSYGLLGHHFFGMGIPEIAREIEQLPHAATTAIRRRYVLQRHRQHNPRSNRKRRRGQDGILAEDAEDSDPDDFHNYLFSHRLPTSAEMALAMKEVEQVVEAEEHARLSTGAVRTDGLEREPPSSKTKTARRRLNKDATRDTEVLPSEKAAVSRVNNTAVAGGTTGTTTDSTADKDKTGATMDLEHLPIAMQYRELRRRPFDERLEVRKSKIHGYGLFTKEKMVEGQMIVEYQGQMIAQHVADVREKQYEDMGIGSCYMFRLDEKTIIDATRCGNLARFMNHSCDPKAFARVVVVENQEKKIVIFAKRTIEAGEEVTYDYKFPIEDEAIRCDCGAYNCVGRMN